MRLLTGAPTPPCQGSTSSAAVPFMCQPLPPPPPLHLAVLCFRNSPDSLSPTPPSLGSLSGCDPPPASLAYPPPYPTPAHPNSPSPLSPPPITLLWMRYPPCLEGCLVRPSLVQCRPLCSVLRDACVAQHRRHADFVFDVLTWALLCPLCLGL